MKTNSTSANGLDEIVFENRNKSYGAYALRKGYDANMNKAFIFLISGVAFLIIYTRITSHIKPLEKEIVEEIIMPFQPMKNLEIVIEKQIAPEPPHVSLKQKQPDPEMIIKPDVKVPAPSVKPLELIIPGTATSATASTVQGNITASIPIGKTGNGNVIDIEFPSNQVLDVADITPEFPGGQEALSAYLRSEIHIPAAAEVAQITGKVLISFVVETDGSISNVKVERGRGYGLDEEAERVVKQMPNWNSGKNKGQKVRVKFFLPIHFDF